MAAKLLHNSRSAWCKLTGVAAFKRNFSASPTARGLLKGLHPHLTADLLWVLRAAGHGDTIAIVDANFPAYEVSTCTTSKKRIELVGIDLPTALEAILEVYPMDYFIDEPARHMAPTVGPLPPLGQECIDMSAKIITAAAPGIQITPLERFEYYDKAREAFAVIQCIGERRPYGNFLLTKGVVGPDGNDLMP
eukprot:m.135794 g.135794  ORF g.135794 m.135794 type:complete len:192 (-) comp17568_c0_seq3:757-1332(-)